MSVRREPVDVVRGAGYACIGHVGRADDAFIGEEQVLGLPVAGLAGPGVRFRME